jgi:hypothetical protein
MKKQIIISTLVSSLLVQPSVLSATSIWDDNSVLKNRTSSGVATDSASSTTYYHGGGIEVRFKRSGAFPPIVNIGGPSIKADCSSLSLDMGYASLINLQQLGKQLSQVGSSIVWGVMVGMVYTMPGISQAFKFINEWAGVIQDFLQNACADSKAAGANLGNKIWGKASERLSGITDDWGPDAQLSKKPSVANMLEGIFGKGTPAEINNLTSDTINELFSDVNGLASKYINTLIATGAETVNFTDESISNPIELSKIGLSTSSQMIVYFILSLTDDVGISETTIGALKSAMTDSKKLAKIIEDKTNEKTFATSISKLNVSDKAFVSYFLNGVNEGGPFEKMRDIKVVLFNLDNGRGYKEKFVLLTDGTGSEIDVFKNWKAIL